MIEIAQDDENPTVFRPECIFDWYSDIVEGDKSCPGRRRVGGLYWFGRDALLTGDENNGEATLSGQHVERLTHILSKELTSVRQAVVKLLGADVSEVF